MFHDTGLNLKLIGLMHNNLDIPIFATLVKESHFITA